MRPTRVLVTSPFQIGGDVITVPAVWVVVPRLGTKGASLQGPPNRRRRDPVNPRNFVQRQNQWQGSEIRDGDRNKRDSSGTWHDESPLHQRSQADADRQDLSRTMVDTLYQPGAVETEYK
jgi:hypothetical protein